MAQNLMFLVCVHVYSETKFKPNLNSTKSKTNSSAHATLNVTSGLAGTDDSHRLPWDYGCRVSALPSYRPYIVTARSRKLVLGKAPLPTSYLPRQLSPGTRAAICLFCLRQCNARY
eukprot:257990-Rhodomonas_salina.2